MVTMPDASTSTGNVASGTVAGSCVTLPVRSDRKSTRLNSSHSQISYAVFCLKKKKTHNQHRCPAARPSRAFVTVVCLLICVAYNSPKAQQHESLSVSCTHGRSNGVT